MGTHYSDAYRIHLFRLTPDAKDIVPQTDHIIHQSKGGEANNLYKINGWYYHFFSEVKPEGRSVMMERSKKIFGPYVDGFSQFYFSQDGKVFKPFGSSYPLAWGAYRGDRIAIYNYDDLDDKGYIEVDYLHYSYK